MSVLLSTVSTARTLREARVKLDAYAVANGLTRQEALRALAAQGANSSSNFVRELLEDFEADRQWQLEHPVAAVLRLPLDSHGIGSVAVRRAKRWLNDRPGAAVSTADANGTSSD